MGCCNSRTASNSIDISSDLIKHGIINRLAIDPSGVIGSLYNARLDCLLETPVLNIPSTVISLSKKVYELTIDTDKLEGISLPEMINIDKELCLSVYLNMVPNEGTSLLIKQLFTINEYTRFFSYYYRTRQVRITNEQNLIKSKTIRRSVRQTPATHVVTEIQSGIHIIVILQLSPKYEFQLDDLLKIIKSRLLVNNFQIDASEEDLLKHFTNTNVFSNIPNIAKLTTLTDVCRKISEIASDVSHHYPLEYTLQPIRSFFRSYPMDRGYSYSFKKGYIDEIDEYFYQLLLARKSLKTPMNSDVQKLINKYFLQQYRQVQQQILMIDESYQEMKTKSYHLIADIRNGNINQNALNELLLDDSSKLLLEETCNTNNNLNALKAKARLIDNLRINEIQYWNVKEIVGKHDIDLETIENILLEKNQYTWIFCFDDKLGDEYLSQRENLYRQLMSETERTSQSQCVYADFTYCSCQLLEMKIISLKDIGEQQKGVYLDESKSFTFNFINVLLLGESGVGKSTFINALANYLTFDTLEQARSCQPVAVLPVSFLMTVGDHFEEKHVRFGDEDSNEVHHNPGQSVTQQCRSYVFPVTVRTKIRLIDTPGMGDTRGLDQDDLNMQHILSFINNLPHLNAICILLKPNEARLNVVLRSYFTRLVSFLGENVRNNIIFCFTNTRATFFAPGNTGPLLKKMLESHSIKDIPFGKTNTFCFDSESFRYLVARLNGVEFDEYQKEACEKSWIASVNESNRLLEYVSDNVKSYPQNKWQSIEHAHFQINQLIRPLLETLRNLYRNFILQNEKSSKLQIELVSRQLPELFTICLKCPSTTSRSFGGFLIASDNLHTFSDKCKNCNCSRSHHMNVEYKLEYKTNRESSQKVQSNLEQLKKLILELACFFANIVPYSEQNDPIMRLLTRMITEENQICSSKDTKYLNPNLCIKLREFNEKYKQKRKDSMASGDSIKLSMIYELIQDISTIDSIKKQIDVIKQFRQEYMRKQEKEIII